ncbi:MAG TPA: ABC transporter substrate-binding protein [Candidatus Limnocylindrales bacterium]|nr:ABC transporter substrate-binding protein [Candidatus Limnocylindrales bacterium]
MVARSSPIAAAAILALLLSLFPGNAIAASPTEQVRGAIDRVIRILNRPDLKAKEKKEARRELLRAEIRPVFDFREMAKRSLGVHWRGRTPEERERFVKLFTELLENSYLGKIESYKGERIRYVGERLDPPYAVVSTMIVTSKEQEIPLDYRLLLEGDRWRIYDVVIEGISLVNNYRSQFGSILQRSSFDELVGKLRSSLRESGGS